MSIKEEEKSKKGDTLLGVFDSGVGGFSVYKKVRASTKANCIYYGDCARAPYGNREEPEIISFIKDDIRFLQDKGVTHFVNACNSMSVLTTNAILKECGVVEENYIDMIRAFGMCAKFSSKESVLLVATVATIRSGAYQEALTKKGVSVFSYAYTDLAFAIEENKKDTELLSFAEKAVVYAQTVGATKILYGCTHYPMIHHLFLVAQKSFGWEGDFIDPAVYVQAVVKSWNLEGEGSFCPYTSKDTPAFIKNVIRFL